MHNQEIKIRLKAFDHQSLEYAIKTIMGAIKPTGATVSGPIPLPRRIERYG